MGHNVLNIHVFSKSVNYLSYRIFVQSSFLTVCDAAMVNIATVVVQWCTNPLTTMSSPAATPPLSFVDMAYTNKGKISRDFVSLCAVKTLHPMGVVSRSCFRRGEFTSKLLLNSDGRCDNYKLGSVDTSVSAVLVYLFICNLMPNSSTIRNSFSSRTPCSSGPKFSNSFPPRSVTVVYKFRMSSADL